MQTEQKIQKLLEIYNSNNKVQTRVIKMHLESLYNSTDILNILDGLIESSVNQENLKQLRSTIDANSTSSKEENVSFEINKGFNAKFASYLNENKFKNYSNSLKNFDLVSTNDDIVENKAKRLKTDDLVHQQDDKESTDVECFIPGIDIDLSETDKSTIEDDNKDDQNSIRMDNTKMNMESQTTGSSPSKDNIVTVESISDKNVLDPRTEETVFYINIIDHKIPPKEIFPDPYYLYPILQCKLCGLRFSKDSTDQFGLHIEDHRRKTNALGEKSNLRREFFSSKIVTKVDKLDLILEGPNELIICQGEPPSCAICNKIIKKRWDDEIENWVLDAGTTSDDKDFVHRTCVL